LTFETENVVGYPDGLRHCVPVHQSSDWKCSNTELGARPWYSEIAAARRR